MDVTQVPHTRIFQDSTAISCTDWSVDGKWVALGSAGGGIQVLGAAGWQLLVPSQDRLTLSSDQDVETSDKALATISR